MQTFEDFLNFKFLISPYLLLIFYYIGALGVPIVSWLFVHRLKKYAVISKIYDVSKAAVTKSTSKKERFWFFTVFMLLFFFMEILWRMMFEFLIAYFQMREALLQINTFSAF